MHCTVFLRYKTKLFFFQNNLKISRSILKDRSRSMGLFKKDKTLIIAKFHWTDLVIREGNTPCSQSQINMLKNPQFRTIAPIISSVQFFLYFYFFFFFS